MAATAAWIEAFSRIQTEVRFLVTITNSTGAFTFNSSNRTIEGSEPGVAMVTPVAAKISTDRRKPTISGCQVDFMDFIFRDFIETERLKNQRIEVRIGAEGLALADYDDFFEGTVDEWQPFEGGVSIFCVDMLSLVADRKVGGTWKNKHLIQIIRELLHAIPIPISLINTTSFDPDSHPSISHWNTTRAKHGEQAREVLDPVSAFGLIQEIMEVLPGSLVVDADGLLAFVSYDPSGSSVATWDTDDVDEVSQIDTMADMFNRVEFWHNWEGEAAPQEYESLFMLEDTTSQAAHAFPGESANVQTLKLETKWVGVMSILNNDITNAVGQLPEIHIGYASSFCGARGEDDSSASFATLGASGRTAHWLITDGVDKEIVRIDVALTFDTESEVFDPETDLESDVGLESTGASGDPYSPGGNSGGAGAATYDGSSQGTGGGYVSIAKLTGTLAARGLFNTTAKAWTGGARVFDLTIPVELSQIRLNRHKDGLIRLDVTTNIGPSEAGAHKKDIGLGELLRLTNDVILKFGLDGIVPADRLWEVLSKEVDAHGDSVRIKWTLAEALPAGTVTSGLGGSLRTGLFNGISHLFETGIQPGPITGHTIFLDTGTQYTIKSGTGTGLGGSSLSALGTAGGEYLQDLTGEPDRDNFISYDTHSHRYVRRRQTIGLNTLPDLSDVEFHIARFEFSTGALSSALSIGKFGKLIPNGLAIGGAALGLNSSLGYHVQDNLTPNPPPMWTMPPDQIWNTDAELELDQFQLESGDAGILLLDNGATSSEIVWGPITVSEGDLVSSFVRWQADSTTGGDTVTGVIDFIRQNGVVVSSITVFTKVATAGFIFEDAEVFAVTVPANARFAQLRITKVFGSGFTATIDRAHITKINRAEAYATHLQRGFFAYWTGAGSVAIPTGTDLDSMDATEINDNTNLALVSGVISPGVTCLYQITVNIRDANISAATAVVFNIRRSDGQTYQGPFWRNDSGGANVLNYNATWMIPVTAGQTLTIRNASGFTINVDRTRNFSWITGGIQYPRL